MNYYIIVFKNTLDAMTAEKILKQEGMIFKMMPTPTAITQSCGMCSRLSSKEDIEKIINNNIVNYKNIYMKEKDKFILIK